MIKDKSKKTVTAFAKKILKLVKDKDERYTNILSIDTANAMEKISKDHTLVGRDVYLKTFYDGNKIVGGLYGVMRGTEIFDLHSIIFDDNSFVAKVDLSRAYKEISELFEIISFSVVKDSPNEKFHDALFRRYGKRCIYQYKRDGGNYMNVKGEKTKLVNYKAKLIR